MDRHRIGAGCLGHFCKFHGVDMAVIPALAELNGDRDAAGFFYRADDAFGPIRVQHQGAAAAVPGYFGGGAPHVDIQPGRRVLLRQLGGSGHRLRLIAEQLDGTGHFPLPDLHQFGAFAAALHQSLAAYHLPDAGHRPFSHRQLPQGPVRDPGHGGQHGKGRQRPASQFHRVSPLAVVRLIVADFSGVVKRGVRWGGYVLGETMDRVQKKGPHDGGFSWLTGYYFLRRMTAEPRRATIAAAAAMPTKSLAPVVGLPVVVLGVSSVGG